VQFLRVEIAQSYHFRVGSTDLNDTKKADVMQRMDPIAWNMEPEDCWCRCHAVGFPNARRSFADSNRSNWLRTQRELSSFPRDTLDVSLRVSKDKEMKEQHNIRPYAKDGLSKPAS
jgi:hypothetical protein